MTIALDEKRAREFLAKHGIAQGVTDCGIKKIAGDASFRYYYRISTTTFCAISYFDNLSQRSTKHEARSTNKNNSFILMFAPPQYEKIEPFIAIDEFLVSHDFSAPKIFARDEKEGFLLLEDLGDETYGKALLLDVSKEFTLYEKACDVLLELHKLATPKNIPNYNHSLLFREVMLFVDWYLPLQKKPMSLQEKACFKFLWFELFDLLSRENQVLVLRDYHADNLMILPDKTVGLLDFQDAVAGSKAYDLVSLLEDARRDVDEKNRQKILEYYLQKSGCDEAIFMRDYEILSLQRNIKILGIFARLSVRDGKHSYLQLLPRVLAFVIARLNSQSRIFFEISDLLKRFL